jgi:hypothetical protein
MVIWTQCYAICNFIFLSSLLSLYFLKAFSEIALGLRESYILIASIQARFGGLRGQSRIDMTE